MTDPTKYINCPACESKGVLPFSECCGEYMPDYPDNDLCPFCKEHTGLQECEVCSGRGELDPIIYKQFIEDSREFNKD